MSRFRRQQGHRHHVETDLHIRRVNRVHGTGQTRGLKRECVAGQCRLSIQLVVGDGRQFGRSRAHRQRLHAFRIRDRQQPRCIRLHRSGDRVGASRGRFDRNAERSARRYSGAQNADSIGRGVQDWSILAIDRNSRTAEFVAAPRWVGHRNRAVEQPVPANFRYRPGTASCQRGHHRHARTDQKAHGLGCHRTRRV